MLGALGGSIGPSGAVGAFGGPWGPRVSQDDPLKPKKHCFQYRMFKITMKASG